MLILYLNIHIKSNIRLFFSVAEFGLSMSLNPANRVLLQLISYKWTMKTRLVTVQERQEIHTESTTPISIL